MRLSVALYFAIAMAATACGKNENSSSDGVGSGGDTVSRSAPVPPGPAQRPAAPPAGAIAAAPTPSAADPRPCTPMKEGTINGRSGVDVVHRGDVSIDEINGGSSVTIEATCGNIHVAGTVNGASTVKLKADSGDITIDRDINGGSQVELCAPRGDVNLQDVIDNPNTSVVYVAESLNGPKAQNGGSKLRHEKACSF